MNMSISRNFYNYINKNGKIMYTFFTQTVKGKGIINKKYIGKLLLDKLKKEFKNNRIIIIMGSRQVEKTTLMNMYKKTMPESDNL